MKRSIALLLALILLLCGCSAPAAETEPTEKQYSQNYPKIENPVSAERIAQFTTKSSDMTEAEMRQLSVDFFEYSKTALWTPDREFHYIKTGEGATDDIHLGVIYGGLPYIAVASGNVYRLAEYADENGVVDMTEAEKDPKRFGNQCSLASSWGWARVINSANFGWTYQMVQQNGFLRVGPYTYSDNLIRFGGGASPTTTTIANENGAETMFLSYGEMKMADGLVNYNEAGHAMMVYRDPVVVIGPNNKIDGASSYVQIIDQYGSWVESTTEDGVTYTHKDYVGRKMTFNQLLQDGYLPFTFAEFQGTDPIEETECTYSYTGDTINMQQLMAATVTANYSISDVFVCLKDGDKTVIRDVYRADTVGVKTTNIYKALSTKQWSEYASKGYTVEISVQLGTGECPVIYTGNFVP